MTASSSMSVSPIRAAVADELAYLLELEIAAGAAFRDAGMPEIADHAPAIEDLVPAYQDGLVWVYPDQGRVAGYLSARIVDGNLHVQQVSVAPWAAGRGLGAQLIAYAEDVARTQGRPALTLTTFRNVPWNAPYYRRLGFTELPETHQGPELIAVVRSESRLPGIDPDSRCVMTKAVAC